MMFGTKKEAKMSRKEYLKKYKETNLVGQNGIKGKLVESKSGKMSKGGEDKEKRKKKNEKSKRE